MLLLRLWMLLLLLRLWRSWHFTAWALKLSPFRAATRLISSMHLVGPKGANVLTADQLARVAGPLALTEGASAMTRQCAFLRAPTDGPSPLI